MGKLTIDLGAILGTTGQKTPEANPYFGTSVDPNDPSTILGPDGKPIDDKFQVDGEKYNSKYDPTQRFTPLSDWSAAFHPEVANYVAKSNTDYQQAQTIAQRQHDISQGIVAKDVGSVRNLVATPVTDPSVSDTQAAILLGGNPSAAGFNATLSNQADIKYNVPDLAAKQNVQNTLLATELAASKRREQSQYELMGGESAASNNRLGSLYSSSADYDANLANKPAQIRDTALNLGNDINYQSSVIPQKNANDFYKAQTESGLLGAQRRALVARTNVEMAQQEEAQKNLPYDLQTQDLESRGRAFNAQYTPSFSSPIMTKVNLDGTVQPNTRVPYAGLYDQMNAKIGGSGSSAAQPQTPLYATSSNGEKGITPPTDLYGPKPIRVLQGQAAKSQSEEKPYVPAHPREADGQVPLGDLGNEGYTIDKANHVYYAGKDVTDNIMDGTPLKEAIIKHMQTTNAIKPVISRPITARPIDTSVDKYGGVSLDSVRPPAVEKNSTYSTGNNDYKTNEQGAIIAPANTADLENSGFYYAGNNRWFPVQRNTIADYLNSYNYQGQRHIRQ